MLSPDMPQSISVLPLRRGRLAPETARTREPDSTRWCVGVQLSGLTLTHDPSAAHNMNLQFVARSLKANTAYGNVAP